MTDIDPIDDARAELARILAPTVEQLDAQRARLDAALRDARPVRRHASSRRWLPASGLAVAGLAAAVLVAVALQPGSDAGDDRPDRSSKPGFQLVTGAPGGAFQHLDLDSATAAEVLDAAGEVASGGTPTIDTRDWTFQRTEIPDLSRATDSVAVTSEEWVSPDGRRRFSVSLNTPTTEPRSAVIHFEDLGAGNIGGVSWNFENGVLVRGSAHWNSDVGSQPQDADFARHVALQERLRAARDVEDVRAALAERLDIDGVEFRDGMACLPKGSCWGVGGSIVGRDRITATQSRTYLEHGLLLQALATNVFPATALRAIYDQLAGGSHISASPIDGSEDVELRFVAPNAQPPVDVRMGVLDGATGQIVSWGRGAGDFRRTASGVATGVGDGGDLCPQLEAACAELRDLARRLEGDPDAAFAPSIDRTSRTRAALSTPAD